LPKRVEGVIHVRLARGWLLQQRPHARLFRFAEGGFDSFMASIKR
jgi:hypothetical protein